MVHTFALNEHLAVVRKALGEAKLSARLRELIDRIPADTTVMVTQPGGSGIAMPGFAGKTMHVWFEAAAHYESFAHEWRTWIHCFGFDNAFHYLVFIPALLHALNPRARLPDVVVSNEFLKLEGQKFSTSRKHAIWADEVAADVDHLRLFLALNRPVSTFADFSRSLNSSHFRATFAGASVALKRAPADLCRRQRTRHRCSSAIASPATSSFSTRRRRSTCAVPRDGVFSSCS